MVDVSPEQAANFFYTVEVNLNQTTTMVGYMPATAKVDAVEAMPKGKPRDKSQTPANSAGTVKAASAPSSPLRTEGPAPSKSATQSVAPRPENPAKGKGGGKSSNGTERTSVNKKGQQCIRFFRGACARGDQCDYGHILGTDGKPLAIAPESLARCDKDAAAQREAKKKGHSPHKC